MARVIFIWLFIILLYFFFNNSLVSQLQQPLLIYPGSDNSFWLLHIVNLPQYIMQNHWAALAFDITLTCSCLICAAVPQQRLFTWFTVIGVWILYVIYCSAAGKHYAQIGYLLAVIPFLAIRPVKFDLFWNIFRYWVCFLYVTAGLYKIYYGGFSHFSTMQQILFQDNAEWFVFNKSGLSYQIISYLTLHEGLTQWFYRLAAFVDLILVVGFFTKRFDRWLLSALVLFHVGNLLLLHISFVEQSLIFAPFLPWHIWAGTTQILNLDD